MGSLRPRRASPRRVRFHDLRHTSATLLLAQGIMLKGVKSQQGHSMIVLTSNTSGLAREHRKRKVARALWVRWSRGTLLPWQVAPRRPLVHRPAEYETTGHRHQRQDHHRPDDLGQWHHDGPTARE